MRLIPAFDSVKVVLFDLDDTLCGYWDAAKAGMTKTVEVFLDNPEERAEFRRHWAEAFREFVETLPQTHWYAKYLEHGDATRTELMRRTLERMGRFDESAAVQLSQTYHVERQAALELFPDALAVIEGLHASYPLGMITNGPADIQRHEISKLGIEKYFELILIEGEMGFGKPDRRVFERVVQEWGYAPSEYLMVGNSYRHDIAPAMDFGMQTVWVRRPSDVSPSSRTGKPEELPAGATPPTLEVNELNDLVQS